MRLRYITIPTTNVSSAIASIGYRMAARRKLPGDIGTRDVAEPPQDAVDHPTEHSPYLRDQPDRERLEHKHDGKRNERMGEREPLHRSHRELFAERRGPVGERLGRRVDDR